MGDPLRHDIALYGTMKLYRIALIGAGSFYSWSGTSTFSDRGGTNQNPYEVKSDFYFFYTFGLTHDFNVGHDVWIPIGIYYRDGRLNTEYNIIFRAGLSVNL